MTPFREFTATLDPADQDVLHASIPLLIAMVVGADHEFDARERGAVVDELLAATHELGEEFRWSPAAQAEFDTLSKKAREGDPDFAERLSELRRVVLLLPEELRERYREFVKGMCLRLAAASGGFLGFGDPISEDEKVVLRRVVSALGIHMASDTEREALGFS